MTQVRSENPERLCLVCRTPGHERPAAAHGLCYSCLSQAGNRGQSVEAYIAGDERWPAARPRETFGMCRMACDALAVGSDGLCGEHLRHWRHAGRPAGTEFEAWREQRGEPLPSCSVRRPQRAVGGAAGRAAGRDLGRDRRPPPHAGQRSATDRRADRARPGSDRSWSSTSAALRTDAVRLFVSWAQDHLRLAFIDPEVEWRSDVWDMRMFGKPQAYIVDFTRDQPAVAARAGQAVVARASAAGPRRLHPPRGRVDRRAVAVAAPPRGPRRSPRRAGSCRHLAVLGADRPSARGRADQHSPPRGAGRRCRLLLARRARSRAGC